MPRLPFAPKVLHKSLLLVLVPLSIQTMFLFLLSAVISQAETAVLAERKESYIAEHINSLMAEFATTMSGFASYVVTGKQPYVEQGKASMADLNEQFDSLESLYKDSPKELAQVKKLRSMSQKQFTEIQAMEPAENRDQFAYLYAHAGDFRKALKEAGIRCQMLMGMMANQKETLESVRRQENDARKNIQTLVYIGLIINFILVGALLTWFIRNITGRLSLLIDNARMLPSGNNLKNKVSGADELAYLDQVLHRAAADLQAASEHRQALMEMVAHDLRSPLMSCQVSMQILASDKMPPLPPIATKQISAVQGNLKRVVDLVSDLLTLDKLEAGQLELNYEHFDITELVDEAIDSVAALAREKKIVLLNECGGGTLEADRGRLLQVLTNLLSNAIKFSPVSSTVKVGSENEKSVVMFTVEDQGPGISRADRARIFSKFYQTEGEEKSKGFGLGLTICRMLVEAHGGHIGVDSQPGQGSSFWFQVPLQANKYRG